MMVIGNWRAWLPMETARATRFTGCDAGEGRVGRRRGADPPPAPSGTPLRPLPSWRGRSHPPPPCERCAAARARRDQPTSRGRARQAPRRLYPAASAQRMMPGTVPNTVGHGQPGHQQAHHEPGRCARPRSMTTSGQPAPIDGMGWVVFQRSGQGGRGCHISATPATSKSRNRTRSGRIDGQRPGRGPRPAARNDGPYGRR